MTPEVWVAVTVFVTTAVTLLTATYWHRRRAPIFPEDLPTTARKTHEGAVPLVGIVPAAILCLGFVATGRYPLAAATALAAAVGLMDDRRKVDDANENFWKTKAVVLLGAAALATAEIGSTLEPPTWVVLALWPLLFVLTNAFNFLDNQNGVLLGLVAVPCLWLGLIDESGGIAIPALLVGVTALGVLPFNWPRGRVFLGDCGAYAFGLATGSLVLLEEGAHGGSGESVGGLLASLALVAIPLVDFTQVVVARLWIGLAPWIGDRRHLTHIVLHRGVPGFLVGPLFWALAAAVIALR